MIALNQVGKVLRKFRIPTPAGGYDAIINAIVRLINDFETKFSVKATVGIGMPGAISPTTGVVKNSNSVCLNGRNFREDIELKLQRAVTIENDANCFTLSEATDGAAAGASIVFGVILGTGVGGGLVINGRLINGPNAITGEWGHNSLPWPEDSETPGARCYCGKHGCIETWLCGSGLTHEFLKRSGQQLTPPEIVKLADDGDETASIVFSVYHRRLAKSLASVINIIDPEIIVLGGGLSNMESLYSAVPDLWDEYVFTDRINTKLLPAKYGDASGVRGAAWLC